MDILRLNLQDLIPQVEAQEVDTLSQPTFGTLDIGGGSSTLASLSLTADSTSVKVGSTFEVEIQIATSSFSINEYRLVIQYDVGKLSVIDADANTPGTQVEFLDTVFTVASGDNDVSNGKITLTAATPTGSALQVNRSVAKIKFQAQAKGSTTIEPLSGISGTQLINENGIAIASSLNSLTISVGSQTSTTSSSGSSQSASSSSAGSGGSGTPGTIPDTGIAEDLVSIAPLLIGVVLLMTGINLRRERSKLERTRK